jgi:UDP-N-acetylmuramoyl-L-alanyl-D-glutamate--2,6-diaminopimelate ligase
MRLDQLLDRWPCTESSTGPEPDAGADSGSAPRSAPAPELLLVRGGPGTAALPGGQPAENGAAAGATAGSAVGGVAIAGVTDDSRAVGRNWLFVARPGARRDGREFIADALARGASAILVDDAALAASIPRAVGEAEPAVLLAPPGQVAVAGAVLAERFHGSPSRALDLIGITGTNGKTTTAVLIQQLLAAAGMRCGVIGTVFVDDGVDRQPAELTTPSAMELSALLSRMVRHHCTAAAMECSSHALHQGRTAGLRYAVGVFTNLTGDHLDYHGSMEAYAEAKALLFKGLDASATAVVNADVAWTARVLEGCPARQVSCSLRDPGADYFAHLDRLDPGSTCATVTAPWGRFALRLPLVGVHNLMNALEAAASAHALGVAGAVIEEALGRCHAPPGRLEPVTPPGAPFTLLVDYAHTDDALENVLRSLRALVPAGGRLVALFGCGGDRDRSKRPRMAAVAARLADALVITSDNPRTEDPATIIEEILAGVPAHKRAKARAIVDRAEAIQVVVAEARAGDVIVLAGKGHEDSQIVGTTKRPFDDRLVARAALARSSSRTPTGCGV